MPQMLLVNPARRKSPKRKAAKRRRNPIARVAPRRRRNPIAAVAAVSRRRRRRNPIAAVSRRRRRNPIASVSRRMSRRRRNPISMGGLSGERLMEMLKDGAIGGAGAIAMDLLMGQLNTYLPASFQTNPNTVSLGDAFKAGLTALLGTGLAKHTKGLSLKMAEGSLAVQMRDILQAYMPTTMAVGYYTPARLVQGSARVGPNRVGMNGVKRYLPAGGASPLLSQYMQPGIRSPLLSRVGGNSPAENEGFKYR